MFLSIALILLVGMTMGWICKKIKLPALIGMLATGIILGPYVLDLLDPKILDISEELRKIALVIILTRAGLGLDVKGLKKIGRPAILMCFVPASFELAGMLLLAPRILGVTYMEAAIMGAVLAAVSPAVVVPRMVKLTEEGYGMDKAIPQLILAGASVDDVYVIVLFTTFTGLATGGSVSAIKFINIPVSIILGIAVGVGVGLLLNLFYTKCHMRDTVKVIIFLSISLLLVAAENAIPIEITFASLISIMCVGIALKQKNEPLAKRLSAKYNKLWVGAEVLLFVLVGATVDIGYVKQAGVGVILMIFAALAFRMLGVFVSLIGTKLNVKERLFTMMAYTPKATVQAAIGGVALEMGLACGNMVLTMAVLAIIITAPLGAFAIDISYKKLLKKSEQ